MRLHLSQSEQRSACSCFLGEGSGNHVFRNHGGRIDGNGGLAPSGPVGTKKRLRARRISLPQGEKVRFTEETEELMEITTSRRINQKLSKSVFEMRYIAQNSDLTHP